MPQITDDTVDSSPTNQPVCKCLIIKLSTQVVTAVTDHI